MNSPVSFVDSYILSMRLGFSLEEDLVSRVLLSTFTNSELLTKRSILGASVEFSIEIIGSW